ncbi:MAG: 3-hydroxyacyl-CoA dehydrogenase NAD-binding domain-containing protein, partial [Chloroflexota bacterium]
RLEAAWFEAPAEDGIGRIVIDRRDDHVNAIDTGLMADLEQAIRAARAHAGLRGLIIASGKTEQFVAGADLKMITTATDTHQLEWASRRFQAVLDELAWLPCTTVAAINGPALGGGLELALACDYRVVLEAPNVSLGQPEVRLGLVPAGGGTQRLPRLVGLRCALELILGARRLNVARARQAGLVDQVVPVAELDRAARAWAGRSKRPLDRTLHLGLNMRAAADVAELVAAGRQVIYRQARARVTASTRGQYPAPLRALEAVAIGFERGVAAGLEAEARAFGELGATPTAKHLIWLFVATQRQKRLSRSFSLAGASRAEAEPVLGAPPAPPEEPVFGATRASPKEPVLGAPPASPEEPVFGATRACPEGPVLGAAKASPEGPVLGASAAAYADSAVAASVASRSGGVLGVVGAGLMGAAIAEVGAAAGLAVRVREAHPAALAQGLVRIRTLVDDGVARQRFDQSHASQIIQRVSGATDYSGFSEVDLVVEAVFENLSVKRQVIRELDVALPAGAVIASNTSAVPIHEIAQGSAHPERVVGMHFFSPAERMPLVEVIRPAKAAGWAVLRAAALGMRMGKTVIVVGDGPGFYTSRVLGVMMNEAAILLGEGARIEVVDRAMTAFGFPVGPFALFDQVGLDVARHAGETLTRAFADRIPRTSVVPRLIEAGHTGRQIGAGFYIWPHATRLPRRLRQLVKQPPRTANPAVYRMLGSPAPRDFGQAAIQDRLALVFVNEAVRCLEEGVLQSAADGDLGAVLGLGFPPFRGGPFHYADAGGLESLAARLRGLAAEHGRRYEPAGLLVDLAGKQRTFFED